MHLIENHSLNENNLLRLPVQARYFHAFNPGAEGAASEAEQTAFLATVYRRYGLPIWVLGGGSNLVMGKELSAIVVHQQSQGLRLLVGEGGSVILEAAAGERWGSVLDFALQAGLGGIENLVAIPGSAGGAVVQNIGAYGVEIADVFDSIDYFDWQEGVVKTLDKAQCRFAYRDSIFKHQQRGLVLRLRLRLLKEAWQPVLNHPDLAALAGQAKELSPLSIAQHIADIRAKKLPDPRLFPNVGSFFKNPVVSATALERLLLIAPKLPAFATDAGRTAYKISAAALIDAAGWKGFRSGHVGLSPQHALVLLHYGGGSGDELIALARQVQTDIARRFAVTLDFEPVLWGIEGD